MCARRPESSARLGTGAHVFKELFGAQLSHDCLWFAAFGCIVPPFFGNCFVRIFPIVWPATGSNEFISEWSPFWTTPKLFSYNLFIVSCISVKLCLPLERGWPSPSRVESPFGTTPQLMSRILEAQMKFVISSEIPKSFCLRFVSNCFSLMRGARHAAPFLAQRSRGCCMG